MVQSGDNTNDQDPVKLNTNTPVDNNGGTIRDHPNDLTKGENADTFLQNANILSANVGNPSGTFIDTVIPTISSIEMTDGGYVDSSLIFFTGNL